MHYLRNSPRFSTRAYQLSNRKVRFAHLGVDSSYKERCMDSKWRSSRPSRTGFSDCVETLRFWRLLGERRRLRRYQLPRLQVWPRGLEWSKCSLAYCLNMQRMNCNSFPIGYRLCPASGAYKLHLKRWRRVRLSSSWATASDSELVKSDRGD